jgi:site-specific DNA recombinase
MSRAFGYIRVSTAEQASSGLGLEAQQTTIDTAAARLGLTLVQTFTDAGVSGGLALEHRPALVAAIDVISAGDVLLVAKRDRLGRDVLHVSMIQRLIERRHARVVSAAGEGTEDDGPTSILMRQIIDAFAEYERAIIKERTTRALAAKKARGQRAGHIAFGKQLAADGVHVEDHPGELAILSEIRWLRAKGLTVIASATR